MAKKSGKKVKGPYKSKPAKHPGHYIRDWREHRHLTQEKLAERVDVGPPQISKIENGKARYNQGLLERFAEALGCEPADLLRPPLAPENELSELIMAMDKDARRRAVRLLRAMNEEEAA